MVLLLGRTCTGLGTAIVFFTTLVIHTLAKTLGEKTIRFQFIPTFLKTTRRQAIFTTSIAVASLSLLLFWSPVGAHINRSFSIAQTLRKPLPGDKPIAKTIEWIAQNLEKQHVVAANWAWGYPLHMLGRVKTITDSDHYRPHWIHNFFRHCYAAQSEKEALEYLHTHEATHLMFNNADIIYTNVFSSVGSNTQRDRYFASQPLAFIKTATGRPQQLSNPEDTPFNQMDADFEEKPYALTAHTKDDQKVILPFVAFIGYYHIEKSPSTVDDKNGGVVLYFDTTLRLRKAYFLPSVGWNSLIVRLYIREAQSEAFEPVYSQDDEFRTQRDIWFATAKIWKIHYPRNIKTNPKYLEMKPPE